MRKVLKNTAKTKEYLDKLPKVYGLFLWAKWGILELPWSGKYTKDPIAVPLVYNYYDANGACDEYRLVPITSCSSGSFWNFISSDFALSVERILYIVPKDLS